MPVLRLRGRRCRPGRAVEAAAAGGRDPAEGRLEAVAKMVVKRDRPAETLPDVILRGQSAAHGLSCPSGHAMVIFAITALVAPYFKGW